MVKGLIIGEMVEYILVNGIIIDNMELENIKVRVELRIEESGNMGRELNGFNKLKFYSFF